MADTLTALWARWPCDDAADGQIDEVIAGHHLAVTAGSGATAGYPARVSQQGPARQFSRAGTSGSTATPTNYADGSITGAELAAAVGGSYTLCLWYRRVPDPVSPASNGIEYLISFGGGGVSADPTIDKSLSAGLREGRSAASLGRFTLFMGLAAGVNTSAVWTVPANPPPENVWNHVAVVCRTVTAGVAYLYDLYLNGVLAGTSAELGPTYVQLGPPAALPASGRIIMSGLQLTQGGAIDGGQLGGFLRDVRLYSRRLTDEDLAAVMAEHPPVGLTATVVSKAGAAIPFVPASPGGDCFLIPSCREHVIFHNTTGAAITVSFVVQRTLDGLAGAARTLVVGAGATVIAGPFPVGLYADAGGFLQMLYSTAVGLELKVVTLPAA